MWPRGSARQPLPCNTGAPAHSASPPCPPVAVQTAPRIRDRFSRRCVAGSLLFRYPVQPRALCAATKKTQSPDAAFFNRAAELGRLKALLGAPPSAIQVIIGPPSCGKSGACWLRPSHRLGRMRHQGPSAGIFAGVLVPPSGWGGPVKLENYINQSLIIPGSHPSFAHFCANSRVP
jgi:hypothetical protein